MVASPPPTAIHVRLGHDVDLDALAALFESVGWGERCHDRERFAAMLSGTLWVISAWDCARLVPWTGEVDQKSRGVEASTGSARVARPPRTLREDSPLVPRAATSTSVTNFCAGGLVGFARAISDGYTNAYVTDVVVAEAYRRRGIASRLVEGLLEGHDDVHFVLRAEPQYHPLYQKRGFEPATTMLRRRRRRPG